MQKYPIQFYGRTWIYWMGIVFLGLPAIFICALVLLSLLGIIESVQAEPNRGAEIQLIVAGLFWLLFFVACAFQLYALQTPCLAISKEGIIIRTIGTPIRFNLILNILFGYLPLLIGVLWQFRVRLVRLQWEDIDVVVNTRTLEINGMIDNDVDDFGRETTREQHTSIFGTDSFGVAFDKVIESVQFFLHNPDAREMLPSWQEDDIESGHIVVYND